MAKRGTTPAQVEEYDQAMIRRQKEFRTAAEYVAKSLGAIPPVQKVVLFGSVASPLQREAPRHRPLRGTGAQVLHECKDIDLAVWPTDLGCLRELQRARADALQRLLTTLSSGANRPHEVASDLSPRIPRCFDDVQSCQKRA